MENEVVIAVTRQVPTDVAVVGVSPNQFVAAWSADNGTWIAPMDSEGRLTSRPERVECCRDPEVGVQGRPGPEVDPVGGSRAESYGEKTFWPSSERGSIHAEDIDLIWLGKGRVALVMLRRAQNGEFGGAYAAIWPDKAGRAPKGTRLGPAGEYATRITAQPERDRLIVAWHDGELGASRLRLARMNISTLQVEKESVVKRSGMLASPVMALAEGRLAMAWSETVKSETDPSSFVKTALVSPELEMGPESTIATCRFIYPSPDLAAVKGGLGLVFRDDADKDDTPEFYFTLLNRQGKAAQKKQRISQSDGLRGPSLIYFNHMFLGATIRSFQRNLLIGLNRFNKGGTKLGGEFQVYADKTDFVRVDISTNEKTLMMVYAEDRRNKGRIIAGQIACATN